jgi:hypothetical protein
MAPRRRACFRRAVAAMGMAGVFAGVVSSGVFSSVALAGMPAFPCSAPLQPMQRIELMFGRHTRGPVGAGDAAWARFLAREITPRFPDGLTVVDAAGQWRDPASGRLAREASRLVIIVTAAGAPVDDRIAAIVAAYKQRFRQKSVGVVTSAVCAGF